ncbi:MAG: FkbM family methyltransferase [Woeseiaceae bacterium]|nr:FkbM family methyltransferase [Woeseiaceae bacterium]
MRVPKRVGDGVVAELGLDRIDLLKIDVEAHEAYVLIGLINTLRELRPFITMEWAGDLTIERLRGSEVMRFLEENYTIHVLGTRHERTYWEGKRFAWLKRKFTCLFLRPYPLLYDFDPTRLYLNLLLVPKGREELLPDFRPAAKTP